MKMKALSVFLALVAVTAARKPDPSLDEHWNNFKGTFNKTYGDAYEELMRRLIFEQNHNFIEMHNSDPGEFEFTLGMNQFGDLTNREFRELYHGYKPSPKSTLKPAFTFTRATDDEEVPEKIDWRDHGYVTPVKNQGQCGSCWAFSAVGALEGQHYKSTGKLVSLSEQNLVDCSDTEGNHGCNGGWMDSAFEYVKDNKGIDTEDGYPYKGVDQNCHYRPDKVGATAKGFFDIQKGDEEALRQAVGTRGPVSVAIDATSILFQFYRGGVYNVPWCNSEELDHGVLVVGYGTQFQGKDYWLVKNSWGEGWGIYGYIMMSRNKGNQCGIASKASLPLV